MTATVGSKKMKQKVAASFAIVLALALISSTNPAMIMPSSIFGSSGGGGSDGGGSDGGGSGGDDRLRGRR